MGVRKGEKKSARRVLADHKKVGKRYIPPMLQIGPMEFINWRSSVIPELVWIAALIDRFGIARAGDLCVALARCAQGAMKSQTHVWLGAASAYRLLNGYNQTAVAAYLRESGELSSLKDGMRSLACYYPTFPLRFLYEGETLKPQGANQLQSFKALLASLFNRTAHLATFTQAHGVYIAFVSGMLKVAPHLSLASFPHISEYPKTELSKQIAAAVRSTVSSLVGMHQKAHACSWHFEFWNRGFELEACDLGWE